MKTELIFGLFVVLCCVSARGDVIISRDNNSPVSDVVVGNTTAATLGTFRLTNNDSMDDVRIASMLFDVSDYAGAYFLKSGGVVISQVVAMPYQQKVQYSLNSIIPANSSMSISLMASLSAVDGVNVLNGTPVSVGLKSQDSVSYIDCQTNIASHTGAQTAIANTMVLYKTKPTFALGNNSPHGEVIPGAQNLLAKFAVSADYHGDVSFNADNGNSLTVGILGTQYADGIPDIYTLKNVSGTLLGTISVPDGSTSMTFTFDRTIGAGMTDTLCVYSEVSDYANIQLWLDGGNPNNVGWGIDGIGNYHEADKLFGNGIYANSLVNPTITPEPSTIALLISGILAGGLFSRRKK